MVVINITVVMVSHECIGSVVDEIVGTSNMLQKLLILQKYCACCFAVVRRDRKFKVFIFSKINPIKIVHFFRFYFSDT